jgi:hypothetical protein
MNSKKIGNANDIKAWLITVGLLLLTFFLFVRFVPVGVDWWGTYDRLTWRDPFAVPTFTNPPWALLLLPHVLLPLRVASAVNLLLNVLMLAAVVWRFGGRGLGLMLTFTSPVFFDLVRTNNIEWIICIGLLISAQWGLILLAVKPQIAMGVMFVWLRRYGACIFVPLVIVVLFSLAVWGLWPLRTGLPAAAAGWNLAPWPIGVLPGMWLLWRAWRDDDEALAIIATPLLVNYIAGYSLVVPLAVAAGRWPRAAAAAWFVLWWFFVVELRR